MKIAKYIYVFLVVATFAMFALRSASAFNFFCQTDKAGNCVSGVCKDNPDNPTCKQNNQQLNTAGNPNPALHQIHVAVDLLATVAGVAAVIIIIYSGFEIATAGGGAGGNSTKAKDARSAMVGAAVGLVVIALAWTIITFVSDRILKT